MDTLPDDEFIEIFDRVSQRVALGRSQSAKDVDNRVKRILKLQKLAYQTAKKRSTVRRYRTDYRLLRTLRRHGFADRAWGIAESDPGGIVDLTLRYGRDKAKKIKLERERRRMGRLRRIR